MKYDKLRNEKLFSMGRWLLLAALVLCAGCFYSCGGKGEAPEPVLAAAEAGFSEERQKPVIEETGETQEAEGREAGTEPETTEPETIPVCYVYVCGQVHQPGVYVLEEGQRIYEAVEMAGGLTAEAADGYLNLAVPVKDGMKIQVPDKSQAADPVWAAKAGLSGESGIPGSAASGSGGPQITAKVNLNTATREELMTLTGIGQSRAEDIIRYREKNGGFARIEDIMKVSGIKEASFEKIKDQITV